MKYSLKRALALLIALLMAIPTFAYAEEPAGEAVAIDGAAASIADEQLVVTDETDPHVEGDGVILLGDIDPKSPEDDSDGPETAETPVVPFNQAVTIDGVTFNVTAGIGVFPDGAALRVEKVDDAAAQLAVEVAVGAEGICTHHLYRLEVLDSAGNIILPDFEQGVPDVRLEGLKLSGNARVALYDEYTLGAYEIDATVNAEENALGFALVDVNIYDIFTIEPLSEQEEALAEQPVGEPTGELTDGEQDEPVDSEEGDSADGEQNEPAEGEAGEPADEDGDGLIDGEDAEDMTKPDMFADPNGNLEPIPYVSASGADQTPIEDYTVVAEDTTAWDGDWYVVTESVTVSSRITVSGSVNLILCDGATLTAEAGVDVSAGNALTVYAQSGGSGALTATGSSYAAGIGGGNAASGGTITINGGRVTAYGGSYAAGIGGGAGNSTTSPNSGTITVNGGRVTAQGGNHGAGIGGGSRGHCRIHHHQRRHRHGQRRQCLRVWRRHWRRLRIPGRHHHGKRRQCHRQRRNQF